LLEGPREPRVDRADREIERFGDLLRRHADPVAQDDHDAPLEGQLGNRREKAAVAGRVRRADVRELRQLLVGEATLRAQDVERPVGDDPVQPRPERPALVEAAERGERALESIRGDVVGEPAAARDRVRSTPGVAPVALKQRGRGFSVAVSRPPYKVPVTRFRHSFAVLYEQPAPARPTTGILSA
jgi:hypothetical protein